MIFLFYGYNITSTIISISMYEYEVCINVMHTVFLYVQYALYTILIRTLHIQCMHMFTILFSTVCTENEMYWHSYITTLYAITIHKSLGIYHTV